MSVRMNNYEKNIVEGLRRNGLSKRAAEDAIYAIREGLYNDMYEQIRPDHIVENGKTKRVYPPIKKIIWAYFNDRWDVFSTEV